ncbi:MAG TPA: HAMP domain-containing sensor histidine kinase [Flavobacteriaceae bacterium]|nr:HAMP domain-containing sensor histidine kinase [Flavobacteriaceae bacterium]
MKIRNKILIYFSSTVIVLSALSLMIVFILFSAHREEEFQQQQFSKIKHTVGLIEEFGKISAEVSLLLDKQNIHDFYDEKMLIYDNNKKPIFTSIDSLEIVKSDAILNRLSVANNWIETKEDGYDLIGVYIEHHSKGYYAISKAYDYFGYSKKDFLHKVLIGIFLAIVLVVLLVSFYLSNIIAKPISELTKKIEDYDLSNEENQPLHLKTTTSELKNLSEKFNELLKRTNDAFRFQKHSIQHISHELKTPIAVLVSELEKIEQQNDIEQIKSGLHGQTQRAKSLGNIINILLQISKIEAGQEVTKANVRIDETVFNCITELNTLYPAFNFEVNFTPDNFNEQILHIEANEPLIKQAFLNLLLNAVHYSDDQKAKITLDGSSDRLTVIISNSGKTLSDNEQKFIFTHFFRGKNAQNQQGFGLGLVLAQRIFAIHNAVIRYQSIGKSENIFSIELPQL